MTRRLATTLVVLALCLSARPAAAQKTETLPGYAEYRHGTFLIVEGQRVRVDAATVFKGRKITSLDGIQLGDEVRVKGVRETDGTILAREIEAKANNVALFEADAVETADALEAEWLQQGTLPDDEEEDDDDDDSEPATLGAIADEGPQVARVQRIVSRILPPYLGRDRVRAYVVDNADWNAMAMANGAIWVFAGLLRDFDDDEVAVVVGHELAHVTHEHLRREMKRALWTGALSVGLDVVAEAVGGKKGAVMEVASAAFVLAWQNGYSRDLEDQADRVGLRYAYEGGFDVGKAPGVWQRFEDKYGKENKLVNFFLGGHSRAPERKKELAQQVAWNYVGASPRTPASAAAVEAAPLEPRASAPLRVTKKAAFPSKSVPVDARDDDEQREEMRRALRVRPGMTADEVRKNLGAPRARAQDAEGTVWTYDDFAVLIVDGTVRTITFR